jgi:superfamily II DNA helicase RecQ
LIDNLYLKKKNKLKKMASSSSSSSSSSLVVKDDPELNEVSPNRQVSKRDRTEDSLRLMIKILDCFKSYKKKFSVANSGAYIAAKSDVTAKVNKEKSEAVSAFITSKKDYAWISCASAYFSYNLQKCGMMTKEKVKIQTMLLPLLEKLKKNCIEFKDSDDEFGLKQKINTVFETVQEVKTVTDSWSERELFDLLSETKRDLESLRKATVNFNNFKRQYPEIIKELQEKEASFHKEYDIILSNKLEELSQDFPEEVAAEKDLDKLWQEWTLFNHCSNCGCIYQLSSVLKESYFHGQIVYEDGVATDVVFSCVPSDQSSPKKNH